MRPAPRLPIRDTERYRALTVGWEDADRDPLSRICPEHGKPYSNCGGYSVCPACYMGQAKEPGRIIPE